MPRVGHARDRRPVSTGAHRDIERQLGAPKMRAAKDVSPAELDELPPGWKSRYQEHQEAQERERAMSRATAPAPTPRIRRTARPRPSSSGRRRSSTPTFSDPTGGRLPLTFDSEGLGGLFIGAVFYALVLSVVDYGAAGPGLWFKAKFLNQAAPAPGATKSSATAPTSTAVLA
jgi:hypothetical protein